jgi:hypothetical protein
MYACATSPVAGRGRPRCNRASPADRRLGQRRHPHGDADRAEGLADGRQYLDPQVTITGTLETAVAGQAPQPLPGEPVSLELEYENGRATQDLGTFTTDDNGVFATTITAAVPGSVLATFAGNSVHGPRVKMASWHAATTLPAQITVSPIAPAPYGSSVAVSVQVTMQLPDGTWVPAPYAPIQPWSCPDGPEASYYTNASGQATEDLLAEPTPGCFLDSNGNAENSWTGQVLSNRVIVPLTTFPTQVTDFGPGATLKAGEVSIDALNFLGFAQYIDAADTPEDYPGATVQLYFQPAGSTTWHLEGTTMVSGDIFQFPTVSGYLPHGRLATGLWEAVIPAAGSYLASSIINDSVILSVPIYMRNTKIRRVGHTRYLTGTLHYLPHGGLLHGVKVKLLVQRSNGKTRTERTVTTNSKGYFSLRLTMPKAGNQLAYAAYYAGGPLPDWIGPDTSGYAVGQPVYGWVLLHNP